MKRALRTPVLPLSVSVRTPVRSGVPICRFFQVAVSALRRCAPFLSRRHSIFQSLRRRRAAALAAQVVYVENVLLGNYLESSGREASQDRGNPSRDRHRLLWSSRFQPITSQSVRNLALVRTQTRCRHNLAVKRHQNCSIMSVK